MHGAFHGELIVVLALAIGIILLFRRLKLPNVLGFIVAGMLAGPHALGWVDKVETVELLAELGVIFLLFVIGMEFSLKKLASIGVTVFVGGSLQALLTTGLVAVGGRLLGLPWPAGPFVGSLVTRTSTADARCTSWVPMSSQSDQRGLLLAFVPCAWQPSPGQRAPPYRMAS